MSTESFQEVVLSNYKFTASVYEKLIGEDQDLFFSPISIQIALSLAYSGASGKTAEEMKAVLHLFKEKSEILETISALLGNLENPKLNLATEIFVEQDYNIKDEFKTNAEKYFKSNFQQLNFKQAAEEARNIINSWVFDKTHQKIADIIPPGILDRYTRLVLVNAIHFKDNWRDQFKVESTFEEPFYSSEKDFVNVKMMHITKKFKYVEKDFYKVLELPYEDSKFRMLIFLPNEVKDLSKLESELQNVNFKDLFVEMFSPEVRVSFPKFKLDKFIDLKKVLMQLGLRTMFGDTADFSEMYQPSEFPLCISDVLHKAVVEVNEEGSEAAAATAIAMVKCRMLHSFDEVYEFKANHSFIFYIFCNDIILFTGKKANGF